MQNKLSELIEDVLSNVSPSSHKYSPPPEQENEFILRYKLDNSWLQVYPWLQRDNNLSAEKRKDYFLQLLQR